ncbi:MAG: cytochrome c [Nitrospinota bacterium]
MINNIVAGILIVNVLGFIVLWKRDQNLLYAIFSISLTILFVLTVALEYTQEWRTYQKQFIQMEIDKESSPEVVKTLKASPIEIKQIWNPELSIADRCPTCHLAVNNASFKDAPEPFRYHKAAREHDFNKIGCTICHRGQGRATETEFAHAKHISHWDYPMWDLNMVQVSCPQCHEQIYEPGYKLKDTEMLTMARDLTVENELGMECTDCHTTRGFGEVLAPDLTEYGARSEHEFEMTHDMENVEGKKDMYSWTLQHFIDPIKITPGNPEMGLEATIMPNFGFTDEEAHALTALVFSFQSSTIPANYVYKPPTLREKRIEKRVSFIQAYQESFENFDELPEGQRLFIRANCWFCHTINGKGGKVGPDLTKVGKRFTIEKILVFWKTVAKKERHPMATRFKKFNEDEKGQIAHYLSTLK